MITRSRKNEQLKEIAVVTGNMLIKDPQLLIEALKWEQEQPEVYIKARKFMMDYPGIVLKISDKIDEYDKKLIIYKSESDLVTKKKKKNL